MSMGDPVKKRIAVCMGNIDEEYTGKFMEYLHKYGKENNCEFLFFYSFSSLYFMDTHDLGERKIFQLINYEMLDAILLFPICFNEHTFLTDILRKANLANVPVISVDMELEGCINLAFDDRIAFRELTRHVVEKHGAKRVNFISGVKGDPSAERRLASVRETLEELGLPLEEERIGYGDFWDGPTFQVLEEFDQTGLEFPDAIICANDSMAIAAYEYCRRTGRKVPEEVIVTGYDGIIEAFHHTPSITTGRQDIVEATKQIFVVLNKLFQGEEVEKNISIAPEIIYGGSCGCVEGNTLVSNELIRSLYLDIAGEKYFVMDQIRMSAFLMGSTAFTYAFDSIMRFAGNLYNKYFCLCIADDFLEEEEFSDIMEKKNFVRTGYSSKMNRMIYRKDGQWQGMIDFETKQVLPDLDEILEDTGGVFLFPLHIHDRTIGYSMVSFDNEDSVDMIRYYQFFMNVSNALELTKTNRRQQIIIQNLENKYVHDPLTGLFNRRGFFQKAEPMKLKCQETGEYLMVISIDLNGLKTINDTYGHADGDIAISTIAKALQSCQGMNDVCARFGGDEFVVAGISSEEGYAKEFIAKVRAYLDEFNASSGKPYEVDASMGPVVGIPGGAITLEELIKEADVLMYEEKVRAHKARGM